VFYTYILECADKSFYTGITHNLDARIDFHNSGINKESYTHTRLPVKLVYFEETDSIIVAKERESQIKGWSRKKKESLIKGNVNLLPQLARKVFKCGK